MEHLRWKLDGAAPGERFHSVGEVDGRIVAAYICILQRFRSAQGPIVVLRSWDGAVHPEFQGQGLIGELRSCFRNSAIERADFEVGAFTRNDTMRRALDRDGRIMLPVAIETAIAPLTLSSAISALKFAPHRGPRKLARSAASLAQWAQLRTRAQPSEPAVCPAERFDERAARLVEAASAPFDLLLDRSVRLLNWRYADERAGRFEIRAVEEEGRLAGYAVLRATGGRAYLADLLALPERPDVVTALARNALASFRAAGATSVRCLIPSAHPYRPILRSCGFVARRRPIEPFSIVPYHASPQLLAFLQRPDLGLHLMVGDSDTI